MVSTTEPNQEKGWKAHLLVVAVIAASVLFILTSAAPAAQSAAAQPATTSGSYQPAPAMNTNITWSTFQSGWNPLEYTNGTANLTLNTQKSAIYANSISVNPADIQANGTLTHDRLGSNTNWDNTSSWTGTGPAGSAETITEQANGDIQIKDNTSTASTYAQYVISTPLSSFPSNNPQYDYITIITGVTGNTLTGVAQCVLAGNGSAGATLLSQNIGQTTYLTESLQSFQKGNNYNPSFNTSGKGTASELALTVKLTLPASSTTEYYTLTIYGLAFTDFPLTFGENATSATPTTSENSLKLAALNPDFPWTEINNEGYSLATSQPMQNLTTQQTSINDGSYTEQATYQGTFSLPTAPDLSYSSSNISVLLTIPGAQYEVANLNGASYLTTIQSKTNGTFTFATVNPNTPNSLILEVKYTTSQWDASSSPPSFFSLAGLEYYWWATLIAIMSFVGLGSVALSHFGADEEGLRIPKGKFGR